MYLTDRELMIIARVAHEASLAWLDQGQHFDHLPPEEWSNCINDVRRIAKGHIALSPKELYEWRAQRRLLDAMRNSDLSPGTPHPTGAPYKLMAPWQTLLPEERMSVATFLEEVLRLLRLEVYQGTEGR